MEKLKLDNRACQIIGEEGPVFFYGLDTMEEDLPANLYARVKKETNEPFILAAFGTDDWNADFSPWEAEGLKKGTRFPGAGRETLRFLTETYIPYIRENYPGSKQLCSAGYSLGALWALWAAYETDVLDGCVCCSGSLWYPGWDEYMKGRSFARECKVYLSLGIKEEKTRNPVMSRVGDNTREQFELLKSDANVQSCTLEWNEGGHFADVAERVGKGIVWWMK